MPIPGKMRVRFLVIAAGLAIAGLSACDSSSGPALTSDSDTRQVTVVGAGKVSGTPDTLTANVSMEFIAPDVTGAMNQSSERQQAVINALTGAGVDRDDISTTEVSLQPQFAGGGDNPQSIVGYRASNSIDVKIRDLSSASQKLALIVSTGGDATRINSVNYTIEDDSQLVIDARARAFEDARARAEQYAELSGLTLGDVISISEVAAGTTPPTPTPMPRAAMEAVPLEPGQQTVGFNVTVVWELT
ncbi:SIMPL domain-containing protein [Mycobacterium hubeiense]|uniref:SIMPL domain-containing protein n=1 Tax=Mycobacterium hubeiense TaxID=1867256 RepID=UPI000C7F1299|nr:SIMPL domain-containing protein [Mycobacterium sp. QGD 101]